MAVTVVLVVLVQYLLYQLQHPVAVVVKVVAIQIGLIQLGRLAVEELVLSPVLNLV
jgi:hypothetical protein